MARNDDLQFYMPPLPSHCGSNLALYNTTLELVVYIIMCLKQCSDCIANEQPIVHKNGKYCPLLILQVAIVVTGVAD